MLKKVLIANRGEIACRILKTLRELGISSVAVYSEADRNAPHVGLADEAFLLGPAPVSSSYLNQERLLEIIAETKADGVHPGYGLLSENPEFAEACEKAGAVWIGPTPEQMRLFGLKHTARSIAQNANVPLLVGTDLIESIEEAVASAETITYPVMLKSTAGGGGIGMKVCHDEQKLRETFEAVRRLSQANFGKSGVFLEKFIARARHIEVQIFGDGNGKVVAIGERDCSAQRRNQKVVEESPAPGITPQTRKKFLLSAERLGSHIQYRSAGTVEYLFDADSEQFYFLEVNTRLQVEHPITECRAGIDLVAWMVELASGKTNFIKKPRSKGHAIEVRLYAEDPFENFLPSSGLLTQVKFPESARIDSWISTGTEVSPHYDPLLAKIIVHASSREKALEAMSKALADSQVAGIETNLAYLSQIISSELFISGEMTTRALDSFEYTPSTISVLSGGMQTTIQDFPGRLHYWHVGIPPSGPMDSLSFRQANRILGNPDDAAGMEITQLGPSLRFNCSTKIVVTGASFPVRIDDRPCPFHQAIDVAAGSVLQFGTAQGPGCRAYLAVQGGFDVPDYMGSKSTFTLGQFGGHGGRALRTGDVLPIKSPSDTALNPVDVKPPEMTSHWEIGVLYGPHGSPDYFTVEDIEMFFTTDWEVHYNSARTGIRLIGPKPKWARSDGGEAGLHPSNIHDNAYAIGAIDFTGDMPVILGPDGPSLGGFVCPAVVTEAELWKTGQLRPGDKVRFINLAPGDAKKIHEKQKDILNGESVQPFLFKHTPVEFGSTTLFRNGDTTFRRAGDSYLLIEFGEPILDLELRFKVHVFHQWLLKKDLPGVIDLTPGIRSLQIHFDQDITDFQTFISAILQAEAELTDFAAIDIPSRIVHLPLSWDDPSTRVAIEKYTRSVYPDAPWCPSNIEFIRRINGLESIDEVYRTVFDASYLVMGLGDVYLGAPVATPLDPRHRLVTTKYNPARTWTPENAVGIGGAYLCIYGMEGPGGYQFVGRTVQMWNRYKSTENFLPEKPWLLRFFDQIRFYPVSPEELAKHRDDFLEGRFKLRVEKSTFNLRDYQKFLSENAESIASFREGQQRAFQEERQRWKEAGLQVETFSETGEVPEETNSPPQHLICVESPINGNVWKILVTEEQQVEANQTVAILEAMKMEIPITAPEAGTIERVLATESTQVRPGQDLVWLAPN